MMKRHLIACVKEGKIMFVVNKLFRLLEQEGELRDEFHTVTMVSSTLERTEKYRMNGTITWEIRQSIIGRSELTILKVIDELPENVLRSDT